MAPENYSWGKYGFSGQGEGGTWQVPNKYIDLFVGAQLSANVGQLPINSYMYYLHFWGCITLSPLKIQSCPPTKSLWLERPYPNPIPNRACCNFSSAVLAAKASCAIRSRPLATYEAVSRFEGPKAEGMEAADMGHNHPQLEDKDFNLWRFSCFSSRFLDSC